MPTELLINEIPCLKSEKFNSLVTRNLFNFMSEKNSIDLDTFFDKFKNHLFITELIKETILDSDGCLIKGCNIFSGRISKTDEDQKYKIHEEAYFLEEHCDMINLQTKNAVIKSEFICKSAEDTYDLYVAFFSKNDPSSRGQDENISNIKVNEIANPSLIETFNKINFNFDSEDFKYNTPYDYAKDDSGNDSISEIDFILETINILYREDSYRVKDSIRDLYAIIKCRKKAKELAVNDEEFIALDQAMNFFYLTHFYQKKKRDQALNIVTKHYGVSRDKIISIWNSLVNYKRHFGEEIEFKKRSYKKSKR